MTRYRITLTKRFDNEFLQIAECENQKDVFNFLGFSGCADIAWAIKPDNKKYLSICGIFVQMDIIEKLEKDTK